MKIKGLNEYDICNYKLPSMFIIFPSCTFKCDKDCGRAVCQNSALAKEPIIEFSIENIINRYLKNSLTHAVVCGGLEPFDTYNDLMYFIFEFRDICEDPIIIYTGYNEIEIEDKISAISKINKESAMPGKIIIKYGRFIPDMPHKFDEVLGVELASDNQYAKEI